MMAKLAKDLFSDYFNILNELLATKSSFLENGLLASVIKCSH